MSIRAVDSSTHEVGEFVVFTNSFLSTNVLFQRGKFVKSFFARTVLLSGVTSVESSLFSFFVPELCWVRPNASPANAITIQQSALATARLEYVFDLFEAVFLAHDSLIFFLV